MGYNSRFEMKFRSLDKISQVFYLSIVNVINLINIAELYYVL